MALSQGLTDHTRLLSLEIRLLAVLQIFILKRCMFNKRSCYIIMLSNSNVGRAHANILHFRKVHLRIILLLVYYK